MAPPKHAFPRQLDRRGWDDPLRVSWRHSDSGLRQGMLWACADGHVRAWAPARRVPRKGPVPSRWRRTSFVAPLVAQRAMERGRRRGQGRKRWAMGAPPPPHLWQEKANRHLPRSQVMMVFLACHRDLSSRAVAVAAWGSGDAHVQSTATRRPSSQAVGAHGAPHLPFRFAAKPSPSAPWARGLLSAFWERGSPDLPACGLRRGSKGGPARPIFINTSSRPSRGAKPRGADDKELPQARPRQAGS